MLVNHRNKKAGESWGNWRQSRRAPAPAAVPPTHRPAPVQRTVQPAPPVSPAVPAPAPPPVAAQAAPSPSPAAAADSSPDAAVSISIQLPTFDWQALKRRLASLGRLKGGFQAVWKHVRAHKWPVMAVAGVVVCAALAVLLWPGGHKPADTTTGSHTGSAAGAKPALLKPDFTVLAPKSKPQLATPDGKTSAFDGQHDSYSFVDNLQNYGFVVSEQPIPKSFSSGKDAVNKIAPTLIAHASEEVLAINSGTAKLETDTENGTQSLVANIGDVLLFIRSSHGYDAGTWTSYLNSLQ